MKTIIKCSVFLVSMGASSAGATPRSLPFSYPVETLPAGDIEIELYGDITFMRVVKDSADPGQGRLWEPGYRLQNEFEYGLSDWVELAVYQVFEATPLAGGTNTLTLDGFKWEVRGRLADAGRWPVDVGWYVELETLHDEMALEGKVLLAKHWGRLHWMANLWAELEDERWLDNGQRSLHLVFNPTTGFAFQATPAVHPGVEYWARGELGTVGDTPVDVINNRIHHFVGPTVHLNFGRLWWTMGVYVDLTNTGEPQPGEVYGAWWGRSVLGLAL